MTEAASSQTGLATRLPDAHLALVPGSKAARVDYWWNLAAAIILSLATLASAWCGYQASEWSGIYAQESQRANGERFVAARQAEIADRHLTIDLMAFSDWSQATLSGNEVLATEMEARFVPRFRRAFEAWMDQPIAKGSVLPAGTPFDKAEYVSPAQTELDAANARVTEALDIADYASGISSRYVLTSVLFASVLFLAGIASKLSHRHLGHAVIGVAGVSLLIAIGLMFTVPIAV